ncbi:TPA: hypothetical protein ACKO9N_001428 [Listeria monocytogenes]
MAKIKRKKWIVRMVQKLLGLKTPTEQLKADYKKYARTLKSLRPFEWELTINKTEREGMEAMNFEHMIGRDTEKGITITDPKEELKHAASNQSNHIRAERQTARVQHSSGRK